MLNGGYFLVSKLTSGNYGQIEIDSVPSGAEVWRDQRKLGVTPYRDERSSPGDANYELRLAGYELYGVPIRAKAHMETRLLVVLRESGIQTAGVAIAAPASTGSAGSSAGSLILTNDMTAAPRAAVVLTVEGKVEWLRLGTNVWNSVQTNQVLFPGDRLRTGLKSRATLRLPNQSVLRVHQLTTLEIQPPGGATNRALLNLQKGSIFFNRDTIITPVPFVTPAAKGRIEG